MLIFFKPPSWLPPPRKQRSPAAAAIVGFLFGGIGLALYFRTVVDFVIPVLYALASIAVGAAMNLRELGIVAGAFIAARWGYYRACQLAANAREHPVRGLSGLWALRVLAKTQAIAATTIFIQQLFRGKRAFIPEMTLVHIRLPHDGRTSTQPKQRKAKEAGNV
jgi:hypothetical protein